VVDTTTPVVMRIIVATGQLGNMPVATMIPGSNGPDDVMHTHCYYDRALLLATHLPVATHSLGEQIGHLPSHTLPVDSFIPAHRPPAPLLNPSHGSV
jgi:hypothetical protein